MSEAEPILLTHVEAGVATLTLNRPEAHNTLSVALLTELERAFATLATDRDVRVVVLAATGRAFCAGHDVREMRALDGREAVAALFALCTRVMTAIVRLPQPVIAKVQGAAAAAGCQLVASCDLAYASTTARFATPGINLGLFCSTPGVALARAVGRKAAMEMLLSGDVIDAPAAERHGLINRAVAPERLDAEVAAMAARIASKPPFVLKLGKATFHRQLDMGLDDAYACAGEAMVTNMLAQDAAEGFDAFLGKRQPVWEGH
ncbi:enoyl-CoA hydratase [Azospirillum sp. TSO22-1]|uniref:enoyl-CoA hydratase n=1 Tax=Azospirillum sp. TSO22-1 TaxID=716789 RepID=UPI000D60D2C2|nr:enoyl-CoA hydratase [Azospirillum sp. TSO22-1]PWC40393.1 enoyl-CoA hydratase [Azospirillum sp. TSO22-1]